MDLLFILIYIDIYRYILVSYPNTILDFIASLFDLRLDEALLPKHEIQGFLTICIEWLFFSGQGRLSQISRVARCILNSFTAEGTIRPTKALQQGATIQRYTRVFRSLVIFLLTSYLYLREGAPRETPASVKGLYTLGSNHTERLDEIAGFLTRLAKQEGVPPTQAPRQGNQHPEWDPRVINPEDPDDEEILGDEAPSDDDDDTPAGQREREYQEGLAPYQDRGYAYADILTGARLLAGLFLDLACVSTSEGYNNPLYTFLACVAFDYRRGIFKELNQITQLYAAIIKGYQFTLLHTEYQRGLDEVCGYFNPFFDIFASCFASCFAYYFDLTLTLLLLYSYFAFTLLLLTL